ncbi:MAG: hypothetical protein WCE81_07875 [Halobacteriota archaeon]
MPATNVQWKIEPVILNLTMNSTMDTNGMEGDFIRVLNVLTTQITTKEESLDL